MTDHTTPAQVWTGAGRISAQLLPIPDLTPGSMLLRVAATGICGTDRHLAIEDPPFPTVLGHEIAGEIVAFGEGTRRSDAAGEPLGEGDRVALFPWIPCGACWACRRFGPAAATCSEGFVYGIPFELTGAGERSPLAGRADTWPWLTGGFGEHLFVYPGTWMWKVPPSMPWEVAALLDPTGVAVRAVDLARTPTGTWDEVLTPDATAVVQGAGPVGLLTAIALREAGVGDVVMIGSRPGRLAAAAGLDAVDHVIDVSSTDPVARLRAVRDRTGGRGADLVVDCTNDPGAFGEALELVRRLGTVIEVGNMVNPGATVPVDPARHVCQRNIRLLGMSANPPRSFAEAMALLSRHDRIAFAELVTHRVPRAQLGVALDALGEPDTVKVVVTDEVA